MTRFRFTRSLPRAAPALGVALVLLLGMRAERTAAQQLAQVQYRLVGVGLSVSPSTLTVPRGVATQLNTALTGAQSLPAGAAVRATLRGPSFPESIEITATPGQPIFLPQLTTAGLHFLENVRLEIDADTQVAASPRIVNINVLDQLLVGAVTSRPLSLEEIQARGIQFDSNSFQAFMFTVAFTTESGVRNIEMPVLVPTGTREQQMILGSDIPQLSFQELPGLDLPNLGIEALMLEPIEEAPPGVQIPPIPGILVIPGNIAFLNQFFSVFLTVSNRAPDGTPLVVRNVRAEIQLPGGADGVAGNLQRDPPYAPGEPEFDNPLRVARTAAGRQILKPVMAPGADGVAGTPDDVDVLVPQGSGSAEFLVEGIREGGHVIDLEIRGTLEGLPSGPIEVAGHVRGAVVVRDPNFALTFIHPDVVRAGSQYDLTVQIRNTSLVDANLVTVSLDPRNMTGARLADPSQSSQTIPTIRAGDSATVTLRLEALRTGRVNASTLELAGETGVVTGRRLSLRTGVSEQGVPLSSDTLILPPEVARLRARANNDELTSRAVALLGEAHSIASAPRASLPVGVLPIPASTVTQRARELTSSASRLRLSYRSGTEGAAEPLPESLLLTLEDLYYDFLGARVRDDGWDTLYRSSRQARLFGGALASIVQREAGLLGLGDAMDLQRHWADTESYRDDHITVMTNGSGGQVPVVLDVTDRLGRHLGGSLDPEGGRREIAGADVLTFETADVATGQLATLARVDGSPFTATLTADRTGTFDLGIVVTDVAGQLRHVVFRSVPVTAGERLMLLIRPRSDPAVSLERAGTATPPTEEQVIVDGPPVVLGVVQIADENVDRFGRVVGVLFDKDVQQSTAESPASYTPGAATIPMIQPPALVDRNAVTGAFVQFGGRIVLAGMRDPIGPFVDRALDIVNVRDLKNQVMAPVAAMPILADPEIRSGGQLTGRVLRADGTPVAGAEITYLQPVEDPLGRVVLHVVTIKLADAEGRYTLDYVFQNPLGGFMIQARDVPSGERGSITAQVRANGERLALDIVLVGRGVVEGVVRRQDGTPLANAGVRVVSATDFTSVSGATDQNGRYRITSVPVGPIAVEVTALIGTARASGVIAGTGATALVDVTVFGGETGVVNGVVRRPDGAAAPGIQVALASEATVAGAPLPSLTFLDVRTTDAAGAFQFDRVPPGSYLARAIDRTAGFIGDARLIVTAANGPNNPASVVVFLLGTGSVSGRVLERVGTSTIPVPGALVAGGTQIVTADATGQYTIPAVPVGARTIEAAHPVTGARGSREVSILTAGQTSAGVDIVLEPLARITGRVISPEGQPVAGQEVRLIVGEGASPFGGRTFLVRRAQTAGDGTYVFDHLEPREYPLTAVRGSEVANGRARLSRLVTEDVVDLHLIRPTGRVSGRVVDTTGLAVAARVALRARLPNAAGILELSDTASMTSDPDNGFTFAGIFPGPFTATASSFFSPDTAVASGTISESNPVVQNIVLVLTRNTGTLGGCVLAPDGTTIQPVMDGSGAPLPLPVFITSSRLRTELEQDPLNTEPDGIRVDASDGCFVSSIPLPPDFYAIEVTDNRTGSPTFGLTGQAFVSVGRGEDAAQNVRLLGLGSLAVEVVDAGGQSLPGVNVAVRRMSYPNDIREVLLIAPTSPSPLLVEDLTEGPVAVAATVSSDPTVNVGGRDELRGFGGHAEGVVVRTEQRTIRVVIDSAGIVSGRFLRVDGVTPVSGAEVQLMSAGRPTAFTLTSSTGAFRFDGVAVGSFQLDGFDPATGRRARVSGHLQQDRQHVIQDLQLGPLGTVRGVVLDATRSRPSAGAEVRLTIPNDNIGPRHETAAPDGTFAFESVPGGDVTLSALSLDGLSGSAVATVSSEGEDVQIEIVLEGSGRVEGTVHDALGALVPGASVSLIDAFGNRRTIQAGTSGPAAGTFAFDIVPVGSFTLEARPAGAITPGDGGRTTGEILFDGQTAAIDLTFQGVVTVGAVVTGAVGPAPVEVSLQSSGVFGGRATPTGLQGEVVLFEGIPRAPMTVSARQVTPTGTTISASVTLGQGDLPPPQGRVVPDVQLALSQVATVQGVVTSPGGSPVSGARVTLVAGTLTTLALTQADGHFEFLGVPLSASVRIDVDALSSGRAVFLGSTDVAGVLRDREGTVVESIALSLDVAAPRVALVFPNAAAIGVPTSSNVTVTFSEPIDPATITSCNAAGTISNPTLRLLVSSGAIPSPNNPVDFCDDSNVVPASVAVSPDGRGVTLTPANGLAGLTQYTVSVSHGVVDDDGELVGGVRDLVGLPLDDDFTWQFLTRDDVTPTVLTMSPATGSLNVPEDSVIRITFSEPVSPVSVNAASFAVVGPGGAVTGQRELILGNTVAVFTPTDGSGNRVLLQSNATYTVTAAGLIDLAGNAQRAPDTALATFATRDTIAPVIAAITAPPGARSEQSVAMTATTASTDVASVQFFVDGVTAATTSQPVSPGEYRASIVMPARNIQVTARAIDAAGNIGPLSAATTVLLLPDNAPTVTISSPAPGTTVAAGAIVRFTVDATDDVGVVEIRGAASGAATTSATRTVSPAAISTSVFFDVQIPVGAATGPLTFAAAAIDGKAQPSATATIVLNVTSAAESAVIASVNPSTVQQGQTRDVTVTGQGTNFSSGVTTVSFGAGVTVNSVSVTSITTAVVNVTIAADAAVGPRTVTATTGTQVATLANGLTIAAGAAVLTNVTPASAVQGQTLSVAVTSQFTHFVQGVTAADFGAGVSVDALTVNTPTSATATITVSAITATGVRSVTMTTGTEAVTLPGVFTVQAGAAAIAQVAPNAGDQGQTLTVTVTGTNTHFQQGLTTANFGAGIEAGAVNVTSPTSATVPLTIAALAAPGSRNVTLTTGGELASIANGFTVVAATAVIAGVDPDSGQQGQTLAVIVTGAFTHFVQGVTTADFGAGVTVNTVTVSSPTSAVVNITIAGTAALGGRTVVISTGTESARSTAGIFTIQPSTAVIASITPNTGRQAETITVMIDGSGTHFAQGVTTASFGADVIVNQLAVNSPTQATATIGISAGASLGARAVTMTTGGEVASIANGFTIQAGVPVVFSAVPSIGRQAETLDVAVTGRFTSFAAGRTTASFGDGITVTSVLVQSPTNATVSIAIDPAATLGSRTIVMTTGAETASLVGGFTVLAGAPTLLSANPNVGEQGQTLTVVLTGRFTNFVQGLTTASFGSGVSVGTVTVNGPTLASVPITISTGATTGTRSVTVTTGAETAVLIDGFTIVPGVPAIALIQPNTGRTDQTVVVDVVGVFTSFQTGVTVASVGADISVGGAAPGEPGPVTVTGPESFSATLVIGAAAELGPRDVVVRTGDQVLTVSAGFTVTTIDTSAPGVLTVSPANGATNVPLNTEVVVEFNEPIDRTSITASSFALVDNDTGLVVPAAVTIDASGRVVRLVPSQLLAVERGYGIYLSSDATGILDTSGNRLPFTLFGFATGFSTDTTGPAVRDVSPSDGSIGVPTNATIVVRFTKGINPVTRPAGLVVTSGGQPLPGMYVFSDVNRMVTFTPANPLVPATTYSISWNEQLRDAAGNSITNPGTATFTTGAGADTSSPTVLARTPAPFAAAVARNIVVRVTFSERVNPTSLNSTTFRVVHAATGQVQPGSVAVAADGLSATWTPQGLLLPDTTYRVFASFVDVAGNGGSTSFDFTTSATADAAGPAVIAIAPADGAVDVPVNARVVVTMNEPIDVTAVTAGTVVLSPPVAGAVTVSDDRRRLTFAPGTPLAAATTYTVTVSGLRDGAGNAQSAFTSSFTTTAVSDADVEAPIVTGFVPVTGATGVPVTSAITVTLSEPIDRGAVTLGSIPVFALVPAGFVQVPGTYGVNATGTVVTFTPLSPYPGNTSVFINVNNDGTLHDVAGNLMTFAQAQFTTAATADVTAPTVTSVTPLEGATGVGLNAVVVVTFSEPLNPATVSASTFALFAQSEWLGTSVSRSADNRSVMLLTFLPPSSDVTVVVTSDVRDLSGNALADFTSQFTTGPAVDARAPQIVTQRPGSGATQIPATASITLFANEPLASATLSGALRVSENGVLVTGTIATAGNGTVVRFTPDQPFAAGSRVQVFADETAQDVSGNALTPYGGQFTIAADTSTTAPAFVQISPAQTAAVSRNAMFDLGFSEALDPTTVTSGTVVLRELPGGLVAPVALSIRGGGQIVRVAPQALLAANTTYVLDLTDVRDLQGTALVNPVAWVFVTGSAADAQAPSVTAVTPPAGSTDVGVNAPIRVRFSEPVNPLTVDTTTLQVSSASGVVPAAYSFDSTNREVTLTPTAALPDATVMTVVVAGVEDLSGNAATPLLSSFTTRTGADTFAPTVTQHSVSQGELDVPVNSVFTIEFSEPIDPQTITPATVGLGDDFQTLPVTLSVSPDGRTVTVAPQSTLAVGRTHTLFVDRQVRDLAGNPMPFFSLVVFATSFQPDTAGPHVLATSPQDGQSGVSRSVRIQVLFDEAVQPTSLGQVQLLSGVVPIPVTASLTNANRTLVLTPNGVLAGNATYTISIDGVRDSGGRPQSAPVVRTFTTRSSADLIFPAIVSTNPAQGEIGVARNVVVRVVFSEPINPLTVTGSSFRVTQVPSNQVHPGTVVVSPDRRSATWTPDVPLLSDTAYRFGVFFSDVSGNASSGGVVFTTGVAVDTIGPSVIAVAPAANSTGVPVNARVVARLSEPVDATSLGSGTIALSPVVAGTLSVSADRRVLTLVPAAVLAPSTLYTLTVSGVRDGAGNAQAPFSSSFTTSVTDDADVTGPTVIGFVPESGSAGVPTTSAITVTFSEPIDRGSVTPDSVSVFAFAAVGGGAFQFVQVAGSYAVDATGTALTFTPQGPYPGSTSIFINVNNDASLRDLAGNAVTFAQGQFTTAAAVDLTPPSVTSVTPVDGTTDVGLNATVVLTFSEPLNPTTVNVQTFTLYAGPTRLGTSVGLSADSRTVTLFTSLPPLSEITVVATGEVRDLAGNALADFTSRFTTGPFGDASPPFVVAQRPASGATDVPASAVITLYFNEPLTASTVANALHVSENGVVKNGSVLVTGGGTAVRFTPDEPFAASARVQVFLDATAQDASGNAVPLYQGTFTIAADGSGVGPAAVRLSPAQTSDVPRNAIFEIAFSEPIDAATVAGATLFRELTSGTIVPATISLRGGGRIVRLTPQALLAANTAYEIMVTTSVADLSGAPLVNALDWTFNTGTATDEVAPHAAAVTPPAGAVNVGINASITVRFSEPINPLTVDGGTLQVTSALGAVPGTYVFNSTNTEVVLVPFVALPDSATMTVVVSGVEDLAGNAVTPHAVPFTTRTGTDVTLPAIRAFSISHGETNVPTNAVLTIEFTEPIDPQTVTPATVAISGDVQAVPVTLSVSADGRTVSVTPDAPFVPGQSYTLFVNQSIRDLVGLPLPASGFVPFAAALESDTIPPQVLLTSPVDGQVGVPRNVLLQVLFDEAIDSTSVGAITLTAGPSTIPLVASMGNANRTITLLPPAVLEPNTTYVLTVSGVRDRAGNLVAAHVVTFTTSTAVDLRSALLTGFLPAGGAVDVPITVLPSVTFSEPINPVSVATGGVVLRITNTGVAVPATLTFSPDQRTATLHPLLPLEAATQYTVTVFSVLDLAGNATDFLAATFATGN